MPYVELSLPAFTSSLSTSATVSAPRPFPDAFKPSTARIDASWAAVAADFDIFLLPDTFRSGLETHWRT